jgi:transposase
VASDTRVVVSKFADHLPPYRQASIVARNRVDLFPSTLGGWVAAAAELLRPLVVRMGELVRQSRVIETDDTPVPVLDPGSGGPGPVTCGCTVSVR